MHIRRSLLTLIILFLSFAALAQTTSKVVDIPTRDGVTQRVLFLSPANPKVAFIIFPGGHGGLQLLPNGSMKWGEGNFLVRTRQLFVDQGAAVAIVDAPSDRQEPPYLSGFRQTAEHVTDIKAVIRWLRDNLKVPVWLVGTSRGTQSAAFIATELQGTESPEGIVLSSTILTDPKGRPVLAMPLENIRIPVLVVHHEQDGCAHCAYSAVPTLMTKLTNSPRKELMSFKGGESKGDPCEAFAYHGFKGLEQQVVQKTVAWVLAKNGF